MTDEVLCPECLRVSSADTVERKQTLTIRGEDVVVDARIAVCRACGGEIGDFELDDVTFRAAYDIYRARHGLLRPEQIRGIRSKYGIGQKAFSRLLGWGEVTLARYESGALQAVSHNQTLRMAEDPSFVRRLLKENGNRITQQQRAAVTERLDELSAEHEEFLIREEAVEYEVGADVRKLREMAVYFASRPNTWRTKLNKLLFYADFLHWKRHGSAISRARYVRMQFGPVPADFYRLQASLVEDASIDEQETRVLDCSGTVFVANRQADLSLFSDEERQTLRDVSDAFEGWSASRITEFSHQERGWCSVGDRETIDYRYARDLQLD